MNDKIKLLLDKINIDKENYRYFNDAKIEKIQISNKRNLCTFIIKNNKALPLNVIEELEDKKHALDKERSILIKWKTEEKDIETYKTYFKYALKLLKPHLGVTAIYEDDIKIREERLILVADSETEYNKLEENIEIINNIYKDLGYDEEIELLLEEKKFIEEETVVVIEKQKEVKEEIKLVKGAKEKYIKAPKDPNTIFGKEMKDKAVKIETIIGETPSIVVNVKVFGKDIFESSKSDFKIITLKVTDKTDSIYCKIFTRDKEEFDNLNNNIKEKSWYKIGGYTQYDKYSKELVLNARWISKIDSQDENRMDDAIEKRIELHSHTRSNKVET